MPELVAIAADHAAFELKRVLVAELEALGYGALDLGTDGAEAVDYPDIASKLVHAIKQGQAKRGVLLCGSGIGMSIAANRHPAIRAALCHDGLTARLARQVHGFPRPRCLIKAATAATEESELDARDWITLS